MKQEKIILSFIAVLIGLLVSGAAFYFYQSARIDNATGQNFPFSTPTPTLNGNTKEVFLKINKPANETVVNIKTIELTGLTVSDATVAIITDANEQMLTSNNKGQFSTTLTLEEGINVILLKVITKEGLNTSQMHTITYTNDDF